MEQRRADALMSLVDVAHSAGGVPSQGGLPAAVAVTIGLDEAERIAAEQPIPTTVPSQRGRNSRVDEGEVDDLIQRIQTSGKQDASGRTPPSATLQRCFCSTSE